MDSTSVARQRIPLVVYKLSVPHCSPDCRPLLVLIRRPHCQSTPLPHLVHTVPTSRPHHSNHSLVRLRECCTPHRECCTPHRGMLHTTPGMLHTTPGNVAHHTGKCCTPDWAVRWPPRLHLSSVPSHPARHQPQSSHDTGISIGPRAGRVLLFSMPIGHGTRRLHHRLPTCCHWLKQRLTSLHTLAIQCPANLLLAITPRQAAIGCNTTPACYRL